MPQLSVVESDGRFFIGIDQKKKEPVTAIPGIPFQWMAEFAEFAAHWFQPQRELYYPDLVRRMSEVATSLYGACGQFRDGDGLARVTFSRRRGTQRDVLREMVIEYVDHCDFGENQVAVIPDYALAWAAEQVADAVRHEADGIDIFADKVHIDLGKIWHRVLGEVHTALEKIGRWPIMERSDETTQPV